MNIVAPLVYPKVSGVGFGRWIALAFLFLSGYLLLILFRPETRKAFKNA